LGELDFVVLKKQVEFSSFRDPDGTCFRVVSRVFRYVLPSARARVEELLGSAFYASLQADRLVPRTAVVAAPEAQAICSDFLQGKATKPLETGGLLLEHEPIWFPSYASEWCPEMLHAAAKLTLDLQLRALEHGYTLKDATPDNVLFSGPKPIFVDLTSLVQRVPRSAVWIAYAQFVRTFLLPLFLYRSIGRPPHLSAFAHRDGIEPEEVFREISLLAKISPLGLTQVTLPTLLGKTTAAERGPTRTVATFEEPLAGEIAKRLARNLERAVGKLTPVATTTSKWSNYPEEHSYAATAFALKESIVREALTALQPKTVLDVGCNTGHFSHFAASLGAAVVGIDSDPIVVGRSWSEAVRQMENVQPLVVNLARPTPGQGWCNQEHSRFLDRSHQAFDAVLALAVIHHLTITDGIPLAEVFRVFSQITRKLLIVEFVPPSDPMCKQLLRNKAHLIPQLQQEAFEAALGDWFKLEKKQTLSGSQRVIYVLRRAVN